MSAHQTWSGRVTSRSSLRAAVVRRVCNHVLGRQILRDCRLLRFNDVTSTASPICLLDDDLSVLKALGRLFASHGLHTKQFSEPARFLEYARCHPLRLAIVDLRMPEMTGLEVLANLRFISPGAQVIFLTGESEPANRAAALAGGAIAFFAKTFDDERFLQAVHDAIGPCARAYASNSSVNSTIPI